MLTSVIFYLYRPTYIEPFCTQSLLQSSVDVRVTYNRSDPSFYMIQNDTTKDKDYRFEITSISLICPVVTLTESLTPLMDGLTQNSPARYKFNSFDVKNFTIAKDSTMVTIPRIYNHKIPSRMVMGFFRQLTISGQKCLSPYQTTDKLSIRSLRLCCNGLVVREFKPTTGGNMYTECFLAFAQFAGAEKTPFCIDKGRYESGSTLFAFDMMDNCESSICSSEIILSGYMSIEVELLTQTDETLILMTLSTNPCSLDIDKNLCARITKGLA